MPTNPQPDEPQPDAAVRIALHAMGLTSKDLRDAIRAGHDEAARVTDNDVVTRAGYVRWATPFRYLGDKYLPKGFRRERPGGFEVLRSPDGMFDISVAAGNSATGRKNRMPITRIVRGPLTGQAVDGNRDQMRLDPKIVPLGWREAGVKAVPGRWTWLLLHYYNEPANEIRLELSVPIEFTRKRGTDTERGTVTRFEPRLFLPPIELTDNTEVEDDDEGDDEIDIPVDRRL